MSQICDGYSAKSLMGNWYQENFAPVQLARNQNSRIPIKSIDPNISYIDNSGHLLPLERMKRQHPWNTNGVISDYGYKQNQTVMKTHFNKDNLEMMSKLEDQRKIIKNCKSMDKLFPGSNCHNLQLKPTKPLKMFDAHNVGELNVDRNTQHSSFKSNLKPNTNMAEKFYCETTHQKYHDDKSKYVNQDQFKNNYKLVGEKFRINNDPKHDTQAQRSWYPANDTGIYYSIRQKHPSNDVKPTDKTDFRKIRSEITLNYKKPITNK